MSQESDNQIVNLSPTKYLLGCFALAIASLLIGRTTVISPVLVAAEVLLTILILFVFGSIRYRLDKNAVTYGAVLVVGATCWWPWWNQSQLKADIAVEGFKAIFPFIYHNFVTLEGLEALVHADTMLFILGLTFFVAVIAQTRLLESASFTVLRKNKGAVIPTVAILAAIVSFSSGILDGVSMIGLMIRTLVIILMLAKTKDNAIIYAVMVSTIVTTVCGMWLAYGEPPNLIMKTNLHPHLDNAFFLRYCLPVAIGSYLLVILNVKKRMRGEKIDLKTLDVLDIHIADVRFLQATRHGEVLTPIEFIESHGADLGSKIEPVIRRLHIGEPLGRALVEENIQPAIRKKLLGLFVSEDIAEPLDRHYMESKAHEEAVSSPSYRAIATALDHVEKKRKRAQKIGGLAFIPFIGILIWHAIDHTIPLFWASFAGFAGAFVGIYKNPKMRSLALHEAKHEYNEYLFLFPLFLSIALLQKSGFFSILSEVLQRGIETLGSANVAYIQFSGAAFLSALLDNNIVADFASRALHGLNIGLIHLFSMAQIAGYATGGCWTHIGSAQSVVAYAFILKEVDPKFTPFQWIKAMTPIILQIFLFMTVVVYIEGHFAN